jgi:hypothetical protein
LTFETEWKELEDATSPNASGYLQRRLAPGSPADLYLAVKKPTNQRMLLVMVDGSAVESLPELPTGRGIETRIARLSDNDTRVALELALIDERYKDVFDALVADVSGSASNAPDGASAVLSIIGRLKRWQRFLEAHLEGLGVEAQQGLFAELWFLRLKLFDWIGIPRSIEAWTGPTRTPQDFQIGAVAVEVKSSVSKQPQGVRITSERQLDAVGVDKLLLMHLSLEVRLGAGQSLPELVDDIRILLTGDPASLDAFESALLQSGYIDSHRHRYARHGYTLRRAEFFEVVDGFPRIMERDLRPGVGDVHYSVSIGQCKPFEIAESRAQEICQRG